MAASLQRLAGALKKAGRKTTVTGMFLVHEAPKSGVRTPAVAPGVSALPWQDFVKGLCLQADELPIDTLELHVDRG